MAAAAMWGALNTVAGRLAAFAAATLAIGLTTPIVRNISILSPLPDPIEAYLRPAGGLSNFSFFPWAGFVFAGALAGLVLDAARSPRQEQAANLGFALIGTGIAAAAYALSFRPTWYPQSHFWTTSPTFFFLRLGIMTAALGFAYTWELRPGAAHRWSPLRQLGRTSLFIYWIHVEIIYGLISLPLHKRLSWGQSLLALALFWVLMLLCSIAKDRVVERWAQGSRLRAQARASISPRGSCSSVFLEP
jgi:fucose 4-O-acetylase-like acetyltransferase